MRRAESLGGARCLLARVGLVLGDCIPLNHPGSAAWAPTSSCPRAAQTGPTSQSKYPPVCLAYAWLQCGMDPYIILPEKAECVDQQTLKMQVGAATAL